MPTAPPTTASVIQWKSSETIARPVTTGPSTLSHQNARWTRGGSPYSTACHRATPHMSTALATWPDGNEAPSAWNKNEPGIAGGRATGPVLDGVDDNGEQGERESTRTRGSQVRRRHAR